MKLKCFLIMICILIYQTYTSEARNLMVVGGVVQVVAGGTTPVYRSSNVLGSSETTSAVVLKPSGVVNGDILLVFIYKENSAEITTVPSGWALVVSAYDSVQWTYLYWKRASSEGESWTWSWTGATWRDAIAVAVYDGLSSGTPYTNVDGQGYNAGAYDDGAGGNLPPVALTTQTANELLVYFGSHYGEGGFTPPTDMIEKQDTTKITVATLLKVTAGATGDLYAVNAETSDDSTSIIVSIKGNP